MNDNNFEDIVRKELQNLEIEPAEGLMEKIFEARQKRAGAAPFWSKKLATLIIAGWVLGVSWVFVNKNKVAAVALVAEAGELQKQPQKTTFTMEGTESVGQASAPEHTLQAKNKSEQNNRQEHNGNKPEENRRSGKEYFTPAPVKKSPSSTQKNALYKTAKEIISPVKHQVQEEQLTKERVMATHYPLSFYRLENRFSDYYTTDNTRSDKTSEQDFQPVTYKKPRKLRHANIRINEVELSAGMGAWSMSEGHSSSDFTETPLFSVNANAKARIRLNSNLNILAGLSFSQRASSYNYDRTQFRGFMHVDTVHGTIIDPIGGQPVSVTRYDTIMGTIVEEYRGTGRTMYRQVSLPVGLEYQTGFKRSVFYVNGGVLVSLYTFDKGHWLPEEGNMLQPFSGKSRQHGAGINAGFFAGLGYGYKIISDFTWIVEGTMSAWSLQRNPLGVESKNTLLNMGLNTGLRWKF